MRRALELCREINDSVQPDFTISINLSEKQLNQKNIVENIERLLAEIGTNTRNIKFAINETTAIESPDRMKLVAQQLRDKGFTIVLDNFGGGNTNTSFIHLRDLPIDLIKTAPAFIENINDTYAKEFLELIVKWCHSMNKKVCINGVETPEHFAFCKNTGTDFIQGFFFHTPYRRKNLSKIFETKKPVA